MIPVSLEILFQFYLKVEYLLSIFDKDLSHTIYPSTPQVPCINTQNLMTAGEVSAYPSAVCHSLSTSPGRKNGGSHR